MRVPILGSRNPRIQIQQIGAQLNDTNKEIAALSVAVEASQILFLESFVRIGRQAGQIYRQLEDTGLPGRSSALEPFRAALDETKKTIPSQREAEQNALDLSKKYKITRDENQSVIQANIAFADDLRPIIEILETGTLPPKFVFDLTDRLLKIPCIPEESQRTLKDIQRRNHAVTQNDRSFLKSKIESILSELDELKALFEKNTTTCRNTVEAAEKAYISLDGQFRQTKQIIEAEHAVNQGSTSRNRPLLEYIKKFRIQTEEIREKLNDANNEITALCLASEASAILSPESLVEIHQQALQIYEQLGTIDLPVPDTSLVRFKAALEEMENAILDQRKVEKKTLILIKKFRITRNENQSAIQSVVEQAGCLRSTTKMLGNGEPSRGLVINLTEYLLKILPKRFKPALENIRTKNNKNNLSAADISFLNKIFEAILSELDAVEALSQKNTETCRKAVKEADNAYEALYGQFGRAKRIVAEMEAS